MVVKQEDIEALEKDNDRLRGEIEKIERSKAEKQAQVALELRKAELEAENARLRAAVAVASQDAKVGDIRAGIEQPLEAIRQQMAIANATVEAAQSGASVTETPPPSDASPPSDTSSPPATDAADKAGEETVKAASSETSSASTTDSAAGAESNTSAESGSTGKEK